MSFNFSTRVIFMKSSRFYQNLNLPPLFVCEYSVERIFWKPYRKKSINFIFHMTFNFSTMGNGHLQEIIIQILLKSNFTPAICLRIFSGKGFLWKPLHKTRRLIFHLSFNFSTMVNGHLYEILKILLKSNLASAICLRIFSGKGFLWKPPEEDQEINISFETRLDSGPFCRISQTFRKSSYKFCGPC